MHHFSAKAPTEVFICARILHFTIHPFTFADNLLIVNQLHNEWLPLTIHPLFIFVVYNSSFID